MLLDELKSKSLDELKKQAKELGIQKISSFKKAELINEIIRVSPEEASEEEEDVKTEERGETGTVSGVLEVMDDGFGFIRCENYLTGADDVYVAPSQIRRFRLRTGDYIDGITRPKREGERFAALIYVKTVNGVTLDYDKDGKYWAFYVNGEYAQTGVDSTDITAGAEYSFKAE